MQDVNENLAAPISCACCGGVGTCLTEDAAHALDEALAARRVRADDVTYNFADVSLAWDVEVRGSTIDLTGYSVDYHRVNDEDAVYELELTAAETLRVAEALPDAEMDLCGWLDVEAVVTDVRKRMAIEASPVNCRSCGGRGKYPRCTVCGAEVRATEDEIEGQVAL